MRGAALRAKKSGPARAALTCSHPRELHRAGRQPSLLPAALPWCYSARIAAALPLTLQPTHSAACGSSSRHRPAWKSFCYQATTMLPLALFSLTTLPGHHRVCTFGPCFAQRGIIKAGHSAKKLCSFPQSLFLTLLPQAHKYRTALGSSMEMKHCNAPHSHGAFFLSNRQQSLSGPKSEHALPAQSQLWAV